MQLFTRAIARHEDSAFLRANAVGKKPLEVPQKLPAANTAGVRGVLSTSREVGEGRRQIDLKNASFCAIIRREEITL